MVRRRAARALSARFARAMIVLGTVSVAKAGAQVPATMRGTVRDSAGLAVVGARVRLLTPAASAEALTDSLGRFSVATVRAARAEVTIRRIGYAPLDTVVAIVTPLTVLDVTMRRADVRLDTVRVFAKLCPHFSYDGFECRRQRGRKGLLLDTAAIDSANVRFPAELFHGMPGFRVIPVRPSMLMPPLAIRATSGWHCLVELVDAKPISDQNRPPLAPEELLAVEIYTDPNDVPAELERYMWKRVRRINTRCTLVMYWRSPSIRQASRPERREWIAGTP